MGLPGVIRVRDMDVSNFALRLSQGYIKLPRTSEALDVPIVQLKEIGRRGPYHQDINGPSAGFFDVVEIAPNIVPSFPILWAHDVKSGRENRMTVKADKCGEPRPGQENQAVAFWENHAGRVCVNRDFRLNSQALVACLCPSKVLGGVAWPSFHCHNSEHEVPLVLWLNTTLGLISHWFTGTRQQPVRSRLSVLLLPSMVSLDVSKLSARQIDTAHKIFDDFSDVRFLPANEAWRDEGRMALDKTVLVDLLQQPPAILDSLELLRNKWCSEPSVHGGKKTRPKDF